MDLASTMEVLVTPSELADRGAALVADASRAAIAARGVFTIALTGGSSPLEMYTRLATDPVRSTITWNAWRVFWGDDRAVGPGAKDSNFGAARSRLLDHVPIAATQIFRMPGERADLDVAAAEYERLVRTVVSGEPPTFDLVLLGIGNDGHILSLHPHCREIDQPTALVVALHDPPMNPAVSRITFTPTLLRAAREVLVLAVGAEKREPLRAMVHGADDVNATPAQLVRGVRGTVRILADRAAVG